MASTNEDAVTLATARSDDGRLPMLRHLPDRGDCRKIGGATPRRGILRLVSPLRHRGARIGETDALPPNPVPAHATRTDSGRPNSSIRFRTWTPTATSVARPGSVRERRASPTTRL